MISRKIWVTEKMSNFHTVVFFGPSSNCQWQPLFEEKRLLKVRPLRTPKIVLLLTFSDNGLIINQLNQPPLLIVPTKHFALICSAKSYVLFSALEKANSSIRNKGHVFKKKGCLDTVWKFDNFSAKQILRGINIGGKVKFIRLESWQNEIFPVFDSPKDNFTWNLSATKIPKFGNGLGHLILRNRLVFPSDKSIVGENEQYPYLYWSFLPKKNLEIVFSPDY